MRGGSIDNQKSRGTPTTYTNQTNVGSIEHVPAWSNSGSGQCCDDPDHQYHSNGQASSQQKKPNKKKGKNGAKLSQEEINNLSTEELLSYIQNEGTAMKSKNAPQKKPDLQGQMSLDALSQQAQASLENKNMQNFRAKLKAKAMVAHQQHTGGKDSPSQPEKVAR